MLRCAQMAKRLLTTLFTTLGLLACTRQSDPPVDTRPVGRVDQATVFFFGHSLVAQELPAMVGAFARARGKQYAAHGQLGWGTTLQSHVDWNGKLDKHAPGGFAADNKGPLFAGEGKAQLGTGKYDVLVLTESNGHTRSDGKETVRNALTLIRLARKANPRVRVFLYGNWLDRGETEFGGSLATWQSTTEKDIGWWESVADRVNQELGGPLVKVIPGGPALVKVTRAIQQGQLPGVQVDDLFRPNDTVHVSDLGFYVLALLHYGAIFHDTPVGLPAEVVVPSGPAQHFSPDNAAKIQALIADTLKSYPRAGG